MITSDLQSLKGQRIVVKLGTSTLTDGTPYLSQPRMVDLVRQMSLLRLAKAEVLLVSSGAIAVGSELLNFPHLPKDIPAKQMLAALGQPRLMDLWGKLYQGRSDIQAVTHLDFSARIQTVHKETNPRFWQLINSFKEKTGYGVVVNTSFNIRGEPIVCSIADAYQCFMRTEMDYLVVNDFIFKKTDQPDWYNRDKW